jgi:hypothetical protein|nr:MAG TPA: Trm112p-like protein [Caudoviricetes sp.]
MDEKKVREAIEFLQRQIATLEAQKDWDEYGQPLYNETLDETIEYYDLAVAALERQISVKVADVSMVQDGVMAVGFVGRCPNCKEIIDDGTIVCDCGQKLDWSE